MVRQLTNFHPGVEKSLKDEKVSLGLLWKIERNRLVPITPPIRQQKLQKCCVFIEIRCCSTADMQRMRPQTSTRLTHGLSIELTYNFICWFVSVFIVDSKLSFSQLIHNYLLLHLSNLIHRKKLSNAKSKMLSLSISLTSVLKALLNNIGLKEILRKIMCPGLNNFDTIFFLIF